MCEPAGQLLGLLSRLLKDGEYLTLAEEIYQDTFSPVRSVRVCVKERERVCVYVCTLHKTSVCV